MADHLLTFELEKDGDVLRIHGDAAGLRFLAKVLTKLGDCAANGKPEHEHLMTEEWAGHELSSVPKDPESRLLNQVNIHAWPEEEDRTGPWV